MKKFLLGLLVGVVFCFMVLAVFAFALARIGQSKTDVEDGSTLVLALEGSIPEKSPADIPLPFLESQARVTVSDLWLTLRKAAADPRIKAIVFEPRGLSAGWGTLEELKADLANFRKSGKPLFAYLRNPGTREYYLASGADRIYISPEDSLDLKGLRVEAVFLKKTLAKVGATMDVIHAGKYKDAGDMFVRDSMTPETKEVLNQVLDQYYGDLVNTIARGRKKTPAEVTALIDNGPIRAQQALESGLVDQLAFEDTVASDLARRLHQDNLTKIALKSYVRVPPSSVQGVTGRSRIAFIVGEGAIVRSAGGGPLQDTGLIASGNFTKMLRQVEDDPSIKGAILRINSPGGDGVASDDILNEAKNLSRKKPLIISMGDVAASGGYFIAMTGDSIVAYPNTITGSIGVIYSRLSIRGLYDKLGIEKDILQRGRFAGLDSDYAPLTPAERGKVESEIESFYQAFLARVAEGRKRKVEEIAPLAQGRVWLGAQAKENALVNELGGLDRAVELMKQRAGIPAKEQITLVSYPPKRSLLELLMNRSGEAPELDTKIRQLAMGAQMAGIPLEIPPAFRAWLQGGLLEVMPYSITVH
ncbi:MAG TPA: signal peptide peptidase SppA [Bryobacteraceae bacterium]|jgi:protease-4|nr:signal peptide peptidase SppA [Bryobacteraceae bacterium]